MQKRKEPKKDAAIATPAVAAETNATQPTQTQQGSARRKKRPQNPAGWIMSLGSAAMMMYCAYVTMLEPTLSANTATQQDSETTSPTSPVSSKIEQVKPVDERPLFQQRYFRDSATWNLPNAWAVREDASLAQYRRSGKWSSLRPNTYFGMKSQPLGLAHTVQGSLATGLLWMKVASNLLIGGDMLKVRHDTAQGEMQRLEWVRHDGATYGVQRLRDAAVVGGDFYTSFVSREGSETTVSGVEWMQMFQTLTTDAPAPTTTPNYLTDAKEWETKAYQQLRPVTSVFYFAVDCAEEKDQVRLQKFCFHPLTTHNLQWKQLANNHYQLTGNTLQEGAFTLDFVLDSSIHNADSTVLEMQLATSDKFDMSQGVQQLLKELKEPHTFNSNKKNSNNSNNQRVFIDEFGEWNVQPSDEEDEEISKDALFIAVKFTLPPGQRLIVKYAASKAPPSASSTTLSASNIVNEWTESSFQAYQNFEHRFSASIRHPNADNADNANTDMDVQVDVDALLTPDSSKEATLPVYTAKDLEGIKVALSSLLGGMGTFMGQATISPTIVDTLEAHRSHPALHMVPGRMTLTTATPSRTAFPRGFLWDEGFHQLVIAGWQPKLTLQTIADWLHAMYLAPNTLHANTNHDSETNEVEDSIGWIPREMILGPDARQRVPAEFIPQRVDIANPPTFFLVLRRLIRDTMKHHNGPPHDSEDHTDNQSEKPAGDHVDHTLTKGELRSFFLATYPRLHAWLQWFLFTQAGDVPGSFRWRGRSESDRKYIPNTLSSGLDDYPRSVVPSRGEKHVDLHAWMIVACETMVEIEQLIFDTAAATTTTTTTTTANSDNADNTANSDNNGRDKGDNDHNNNNSNTNGSAKKESAEEQQQLHTIRVLQGRGQYAAYAQYLHSQLKAVHWTENITLTFPTATQLQQQQQQQQQHSRDQEDHERNQDKKEEEHAETMVISGFFDVGLTNETASFVLDVLCRCNDVKTRAAQDVFVPMAVLHEFYQVQQLRQQVQQQHKKNKAFDVTTLPPLPLLCPLSHPQFVGPLQGDGVHGLHTRERLDTQTAATTIQTQEQISQTQGQNTQNTQMETTTSRDGLTHQPIPRIGYVSLFPFLLQVIAPKDESALLAALVLMEKPENNSNSSDSNNKALLWTEYGLRSMAPVDVYYMRRNAPGDAPYWRGPIWMNINYLALSALHHYKHHPDVSENLRSRCDTLYHQLRHRVLHTVLDNYHTSGFFWEQYEDVSGGRGIRGHPFTGWTATVVNIFTESY